MRFASFRHLTAALLVAGAFASGHAAAAELPSDLDLVPRDAAAFVHFRAADFWKIDEMKEVRMLVDKTQPDFYKLVVDKLALDPATFDRFTLVFLAPRSLMSPLPDGNPEAMSALVIVATSKPFDRTRLRQTLGIREKAYRGQLYYFNEDLWSGLVLADNGTFLIGSEDAIIRYFELSAQKKNDGPLSPALAVAAGKHHLTLGLNPQTIGREDLAKLAPPSVQALLKARTGTATLDLEKVFKLNLRLDFARNEDAVAGEKALRETLDMGRMFLGEGIKSLEAELNKEDDDDGPARNLSQSFFALLGLGVLREADGLLKDAAIKRDGSSVTMPLTYRLPVESSQTVLAGGAAIMAIGRSASRTFRRVGRAIGGDGKIPEEEHLKKLAEALEKYHKDKGAYPAPATYGPDGQPLLSWRVALLPYLGQEDLYKQFRLDEPWDSLHNKRLLKKLPECFRSSMDGEGFRTADMIFTGGGAAFDGKKGPTRAVVGEKTVLVAIGDTDHPVFWTKPADFAYSDDKPLDPLFGKYGFQSIHVLLTDGTYKSFNKNGGEDIDKELRTMIKRTGKEK